MIVFVDESGREEVGGIYVVAAVAVLPSALVDLRPMVRSIPPTPRRLHWRHERTVERMKVLDVLAQSEAIAGLWSFEACPCPTARQERARRKSLEYLSVIVEGLGGGELVIESRQERNDRRDRQLLAVTRRSGLVSGVVHRHERPADEPGLWLADALAGVVSGTIAGRADVGVQRIDGRLTRHEVFP